MMDSLPDGWISTKIGEIAEQIQYGFTGKTTDSGKIKYIRITDIQNDNVIWNNVPYVDISKLEFQKYSLNKGNILFARTGATAGKSFLIDENVSNAIFASYLIRIVPDITKVLPSFIYKFFQSPQYWNHINTNIRGAAQPNFNGKRLAGIPLPLPPVQEQKRIVSKLDNLFERIDWSIGLLEENIRFTQSLLRSSLEEIFLKLSQSEKHYRLKDICEKLNDGTHHSPRNQFPEFQDGRYKYITSKNVKWSGLTLDNVSYIDENIHSEIYKRCNPEYGDLLITKDGAMTGTCCINTLREPFSLLSSVALVKPKKQMVKSKFLYYFFMSPVGEESIFKDIAGAAITRTTIKKLSQIEIPIPPIKTQNMIIQRFDLLMSKSGQVENQYQNELSNLKALKSSALEMAFKGEL